MVSVHFGQLPDPCTVGVMADSAVRTVRNALSLRFRRLFCVDGFFSGLIEHTDIQQPWLLASAEDVLVDATLLLDEEILVESLHRRGDGSGIIGVLVVLLIQLSPRKTAHLLLRRPHISFSGAKSNTPVTQSITERK